MDLIKTRAFLDLIAWSEGTSTNPLTKNDGYDVIVTGIEGPEIFTLYVDHPFAIGRAPKIIREHPLLESTASGRYQILLKWWLPYKAMLKLTDFSPASQDAVALQQIKEKGGLTLITEGLIKEAIGECSNLWASFPDTLTPQGNGPHSMSVLLAKFDELLASIS